MPAKRGVSKFSKFEVTSIPEVPEVNPLTQRYGFARPITRKLQSGCEGGIQRT